MDEKLVQNQKKSDNCVKKKKKKHCLTISYFAHSESKMKFGYTKIMIRKQVIVHYHSN